MKKRQTASVTADKEMTAYPWRFNCAMVVLTSVFLLVGWRVIDLQVYNHDFLNQQGNARTLRVEQVSAYRGMILDRNNQPLAVSTPVVSIWANPKRISSRYLDEKSDQLAKLAKLLKLGKNQLIRRLQKNSKMEFIYLKRHLTPALADQVTALGVPGVYTQREYRRYYPASEVTAHLVGFTDIDDQGQEGIELAYNDWLQGVDGKKRVLKDRYGRIIKDLKSLQEEKQGQDIRLSIDLRLQYLAYRELKAVVKEHRAKSGTLVLLDARSGEVLALVNQPSYNPNKRSTINHSNLRNRSITDVFEPGSTIKPLTIATALESGKYHAGSKVDTAPGYLKLSGNTIRDHRNYGIVDLPTLIRKSSNVGASKIALSLDTDALWSLFSGAGLGRDTGSGFPGEQVGFLPYHEHWRDIELASLSYGYGLSVTTLQLAQAYAVLANDGRFQPVSLLRREEQMGGDQVMSAGTATELLAMLETVVMKGGTGTRASIPSYRVAGKTGTVHKLGEGGYQQDQYLALFAGVAPVENPRIAAVVVIDQPQGLEYHGGEVAAPVFSRVVAGALRLLNIRPDAAPVDESVSLRPVSLAKDKSA